MENKQKSKLLVAAVVCLVAIVLVAVVQTSSGGSFEGSGWSLFPPLVAIVLALLTKEAYSSLFVGIFLGAFMVSKCAVLDTVDHYPGDHGCHSRYFRYPSVPCDPGDHRGADQQIRRFQSLRRMGEETHQNQGRSYAGDLCSGRFDLYR